MERRVSLAFLYMLLVFCVSLPFSQGSYSFPESWKLNVVSVDELDQIANEYDYFVTDHQLVQQTDEWYVYDVFAQYPPGYFDVAGDTSSGVDAVFRYQFGGCWNRVQLEFDAQWRVITRELAQQQFPAIERESLFTVVELPTFSTLQFRVLSDAPLASLDISLPSRSGSSEMEQQQQQAVTGSAVRDEEQELQIQHSDTGNQFDTELHPHIDGDLPDRRVSSASEMRHGKMSERAPGVDGLAVVKAHLFDLLMLALIGTACLIAVFSWCSFLCPDREDAQEIVSHPVTPKTVVVATPVGANSLHMQNCATAASGIPSLPATQSVVYTVPSIQPLYIPQPSL